MSKLVLLEADGKLREFRLDRQRTTIGRRADNDVCLPFPAVSSEHAVIVTILSDSFLEDLESTNGTLVNGKPVTKCLLRDRDRIDIGQQELVYLADDSASLNPPAQPPGMQAVLPIDVEEDFAPERVDQEPPVRPPPMPRTEAIEAVPGAGVMAGGIAAGDSVSSAAVGANATAASTGASTGASFALRVVSGAGVERLVPVTNDETVIGRAGMQVIAIRRTAGELRVVPLEGSARPTLNGQPVPAGGERLVPGDVLEIAGTKLTLVALPGGTG